MVFVVLFVVVVVEEEALPGPPVAKAAGAAAAAVAFFLCVGIFLFLFSASVPNAKGQVVRFGCSRMNVCSQQSRYR